MRITVILANPVRQHDRQSVDIHGAGGESVWESDPDIVPGGGSPSIVFPSVPFAAGAFVVRGEDGAGNWIAYMMSAPVSFRDGASYIWDMAANTVGEQASGGSGGSGGELPSGGTGGTGGELPSGGTGGTGGTGGGISLPSISMEELTAWAKANPALAAGGALVAYLLLFGGGGSRRRRW